MKSGERLLAIDALRGFAMVWMTAFHLCFDLNHFGLLKADFYQDFFWTAQRTAIVTLFVFCAGLGQAVAMQQALSTQRFWRRWGQIAGCSMLVSASSYVMFPTSYIYFGVLHGIALMLIVVRFAPWGKSAHSVGAWGLVGTLALLAPWAAEWFQRHGLWLEALDTRSLNWLGLISRKPITEDYVPLLPWLGIMAWGLAAGQWLLRQPGQPLVRWSHRLQRFPAALLPKGLAALGRYSLSYYMLHQPVLIGAVMLYVHLR